MLDDGEGRIDAQFRNDLAGSIYIHQVVVGKLFTVQLFKQGINIAVEGCLLMRVLAIAQRLFIAER